MPNRVIKEQICTSDTLAAISPEAERLWWRIIVQADDYGCFDARPKIILGKCLTALIGKLTEADVSKWLDELEGAGLLTRYVVGGKPYLKVVHWERHQGKPRAKEPKWPLPPAATEHAMHAQAEDRSREQLQADASNGPQSSPYSDLEIEIESVYGRASARNRAQTEPDPEPVAAPEVHPDASEVVAAYLKRFKPSKRRPKQQLVQRSDWAIADFDEALRSGIPKDILLRAIRDAPPASLPRDVVRIARQLWIKSRREREDAEDDGGLTEIVYGSGEDEPPPPREEEPPDVCLGPPDEEAPF